MRMMSRGKNLRKAREKDRAGTAAWDPCLNKVGIRRLTDG
jgi:hypothetical protein